MKAREANTLKVGDRVCWEGDPNDAGTVVEAPRGAAGVRIAWDNGKEGWIDKRGAESVERFVSKASSSD